jgi:hypothetical protein
VRRKNDPRLQRNRGRNEARHPFDGEEATGARRQDATLDKPRRNVSGVQQVIELEEKAKAQQDDELPYLRVAGSRSSLAEIVPRETGRDCLEISISLSPVYGPLVLPLFVFYPYPVFWQRNRTSLAAALSLCPDTNPGQPVRCVTHDLTIQAW